MSSHPQAPFYGAKDVCDHAKYLFKGVCLNLLIHPICADDIEELITREIHESNVPVCYGGSSADLPENEVFRNEEESVTMQMEACFIDKRRTVLLVGTCDWIIAFVDEAINWKLYTKVVWSTAPPVQHKAKKCLLTGKIK